MDFHSSTNVEPGYRLPDCVLKDAVWSKAKQATGPSLTTSSILSAPSHSQLLAPHSTQLYFIEGSSELLFHTHTTCCPTYRLPLLSVSFVTFCYL